MFANMFESLYMAQLILKNCIAILINRSMHSVEGVVSSASACCQAIPSNLKVSVRVVRGLHLDLYKVHRYAALVVKYMMQSI